MYIIGDGADLHSVVLCSGPSAREVVGAVHAWDADPSWGVGVGVEHLLAHHAVLLGPGQQAVIILSLCTIAARVESGMGPKICLLCSCRGLMKQAP